MGLPWWGARYAQIPKNARVYTTFINVIAQSNPMDLDSVLEKLNQVRRSCFDDPLQTAGLNYLQNCTIGVRQAAGALPGVFKLLVHAFIPGAFPHALHTFKYEYPAVRLEFEDDPSKKDQ